MAVALAISGVAFAAFCVWLGVRIVNRRERWAKNLAAITISLAYPLSIGPAYWLMSRAYLPAWARPIVQVFYGPIMGLGHAIPRLGRLFLWYIDIWID